MKVDETYRNVNLIDSTQRAAAGQKNLEQQQTTRAHETETQEKGGTEVALSNASREVAKAREAAEASQPERAEKVEMIKRQIADGSYEVDSRMIAEKMLGNAITDIL